MDNAARQTRIQRPGSTPLPGGRIGSGDDRRRPGRPLSIYLDSSALLKRYIDEPDSEAFNALFDSDDSRLTCRVTWVEVWRNLGRRLTPSEAQAARLAFKEDWRGLAIVEVDELLCERAATLADLTGARSLDALHLAAISRVGPSGIMLVTADLRQAQAARSQGWVVGGV